MFICASFGVTGDNDDPPRSLGCVRTTVLPVFLPNERYLLLQHQVTFDQDLKDFIEANKPASTSNLMKNAPTFRVRVAVR